MIFIKSNKAADKMRVCRRAVNQVLINILQSILLRSSQPMCGATGKRCKEDERLLNAVLGPGRRG